MSIPLLLAALLASAPARAAMIPPRSAAQIPDSTLGVDLAGFGKDAAVSTRTAAAAALYADAGVKWARVRPRWAEVEASTGVYRDADVDALVLSLFDRGVKVLMTLDGAGQELYADGAAPTAADGALGPWRDWVAHMAGRYRWTVSAWQIWDEPARAWSPAPNAADYAALFAVSADAIRAARPGAFVVLGGASAAESDFLRAAVSATSGRADAIDMRLPAEADARADERALAVAGGILAKADLPAPALWLGPDDPLPAADSASDAASSILRAKRLARLEIRALAAGAARRFVAPDAAVGRDAPSEDSLTVLRTLAALFDDRVSPSSYLRASFVGAPTSLVVDSFVSQSGAPLAAYWADGAFGEDSDDGRTAVATLSLPVLNPVLVDPLTGLVAPLGSGTLTTVSVPVRDYPLIIAAAAHLKEAASSLIVPDETEALPNPVRGGETVSFRFLLTESAPATIEIFTERGELLRKVDVVAREGRGSWDWTADVGAGRYYWRLTARGQSLVRNLVVVR
jgi:hypothetical protein